MPLAYIDPATGAMLLQIVAASVLAAGVFFRKILIAPIMYFFHGNKAPKDSSALGNDVHENG